MNIKNIDNVLIDNSMPYAMSVITSRALPSVEDGFKPSQRKLLYTMYLMKLFSNRTKCANIVGQNMKLNPHGDQSIYQTLVRMTNDNESLLFPYINSRGNFGKHNSRDMQEAAYRYTEARLNENYKELFKDIDKNAIEMIDNYDSTIKEPKYLATTFPNLLANVQMGIAVGMASNINSFNLIELCNATIEYIKDKNINLIDYMKPEFPTGEDIIFNQSEFEKIYSTGRGNIILRAKWNYNDDEKRIIITNIPYTTTIEAIIEKIISLIKDNKIKEIVNISDGTDISGMSIIIKVKADTNVNNLMSKLFTMTPLQDTFSCNYNVLVDGKPKTLGVKSILDEWLSFREKCIINSITFDINKKSEQVYILKGFKEISLNIDKTIQIIRQSKNDKDAIINLINEFNIDETQANEISNIKLINLNDDYVLKKINLIDKLKKEIKDLNNTISDKDMTDKIIIKELENVRNVYGKPRNGKIIFEDDISKIIQKEGIEEYNTNIILTKDGYFKKIPLVSMRGNPQNKIKDNDEIIYQDNSTNKSTVLIFTSLGNCYKLYQHQIQDMKLSQLGLYLPQEFKLSEDEKIIGIINTLDYNEDFYFCFENGKVARVNGNSYRTKQMQSKLKNAINLNSKIVSVFKLNTNEDLVFMSDINKVLIINSSFIKSKISKNSQGVQIMISKKDSKVILSQPISNIDIKEIENLEYYKIKHAGTGSYLKKTDSIIIKRNDC